MRILNKLSRNGKLKESIRTELETKSPSLDNIIKYIDDYETNNNKIIEKLKKEKIYHSKRISGALKQTINAHGPITAQLIGSACKRIQGALLTNQNTDDKYVKIHKGTLNLIGISVIIVIVFCLFL